MRISHKSASFARLRPYKKPRKILLREIVHCQSHFGPW
jgi:hypothetical protein